MTAADAADAAEVEAAQWLGWQRPMSSSRCKTTVIWYDLDDQPRRCVLPSHSSGLHSDGLRWFDQYGLQRPTADTEPAAELGERGLPAGWKERAGIPRRVSPPHRAQTDRRLNRSRT